jgi:soluble lytic murein transglycosylase-like protein
VKIVTLLFAMGLASASSYTYADVYGYLDDAGVAHFSAKKIDDRYQLFLRGNTSLRALQSQHDPLPPKKNSLFQYLSQHPNLKKYEVALNQAAQEYALEPALLKAVMAAESGFNSAAVSPKGAVGLMQMMPTTAERYGLQGDAKQSIAQKLTDPHTNIRLGAHYLRDLHALFPGRQDLVIAAYNAGEGAVQKYKNSIPPYAETQNYVQLVTQLYQVYQSLGTPAIPVEFIGAVSKPRRGQVTGLIPGRRNLPIMPTNVPGFVKRGV